MRWTRVLFAAGLVLGLCLWLLTGCIGYSANGLRIVITDAAITKAMDGCHVSCGVCEPGEVDLLAWGGETLRDGRSVAVGMYSATGGSWEGTPGHTYEVEIWIDMDSDVETTDGPEVGVDYVTSPQRLELVLEGSTFGEEYVVEGPFVPHAAP